MSEKNLHSTDISKNNILNILSRDLQYEKFIKKLEKRIKNLEKNVLLYVLVNNLIDSNGIWMEFGKSKYDNINHISHYSKNTIFSFNDKQSFPINLSNVEIVQGDFLETIPTFRNNFFISSKTQHISFLCINLRSSKYTFHILNNLCEKLANNCIIIFDSLINFQNYENYSLKGLYDFFSARKIKFEWLGMDGAFSKNYSEYVDKFTNTNNEAVGLRILKNPFFIECDKKDSESIVSSKYDIFDWNKYLNNYPDLICKTQKEAWEHWITHGMNENRTFFVINTDDEENFDWEKYISTYSDLSQITSKQDAWNHWTQNGKKEGREFFSTKSHESISQTMFENIDEEFDWKFYVNNYQDLSSIENKNDAWNHWINNGKNEGRICKFDWCSYIGNLKIPNINTKDEALDHWIQNHKKKFTVPNDFNWLTYLVTNHDLLNLVTTEVEAKYHWLNYGQFENRTYI
jgi:hypothetical protein